MSFDFSGRRVVVTGASRGLGLGIAQAFAHARADLTLIADDRAILDVARDLGAQGRIADITDGVAVSRALEGLERIDALINNAGLELLTPIDDGKAETEANFRRIVEINVIGTQLVTRRALALMGPGGSIVNTASIWGRIGEPLFGAYVASKHAVIGLTKSWAKELGPRAIRVNAVCPGWVRTQASMRSLSEMSKRSGQPETELLARILGSQALPGLMEPPDIAAAYLFLASELAANITGQSLGVDRGDVPW